MKLKIGTIEKKEPEEKQETTYADMTDNELEAMQAEVEEITSDLVNDIVKDEKEELEELEEVEEVKEAIGEVNCYEDVGIPLTYVNKFAELYPKKNSIYHKLITKQFLKWFIKNANLSSLKALNLDSKCINPDQQEELANIMHNKELDIGANEIEIDLDTKKFGEFDLEGKEEIKLYEFILNEKWSKDRTKGIQELDELLEAEIFENRSIVKGLKNILNSLGLTTKFGFASKFGIEAKTEKVKKIPKKEKTIMKGRKIGKAIIYFHHIKYLYNLMSEKMDFSEAPTKKDIEQLSNIKDLLFGHEEEEAKDIKKDKPKEMTIESFFEDD